MAFISLVDTAGKVKGCFWSANPSPGYLHAYRLVWFTQLQQVEILPLHTDLLSLIFKELRGCHITSEMMLCSHRNS